MPLAADLYKLQLTMTGAMYRKLRRALDLFGRRKPVPDEAEILELGLDLLVARLEKKKFSATDKPRAPRAGSSADHIPAHVRRAVWERDGNRCTFTSEAGVRCPECMDLEIDHVIPRARGGRSDDPGNLRLRCRTHNQFEAERAFGRQFMEEKREQARAAAAKRKAEKEAERAAREAEKAARAAENKARAVERDARAAEKRARAAEREARAAERAAKKAAEEALDDDEAMPALLGLGYTTAQARFALTQVGPTPDLDLAGRIKRCLTVTAVHRGLLRPRPSAAMAG